MYEDIGRFLGFISYENMDKIGHISSTNRFTKIFYGVKFNYDRTKLFSKEEIIKENTK